MDIRTNPSKTRVKIRVNPGKNPNKRSFQLSDYGNNQYLKILSGDPQNIS